MWSPWQQFMWCSVSSAKETKGNPEPQSAPDCVWMYSIVNHRSGGGQVPHFQVKIGLVVSTAPIFSEMCTSGSLLSHLNFFLKGMSENDIMSERPSVLGY